MISRTIKTGCLAVVIALFISGQSQAQILLSADTVLADAGTTAIVTISATDTDLVSTTTLTGFELPIEIGGNGGTAPTGLTFDVMTTGTGIGDVNITINNTSGLTGPNYDIQVSGIPLTGGFPPLPAPITLGATPTDLFTLSFEVDAGAPAGSVFPVAFLGAGEATPNDVFDISGDNTGQVTFANGAVVVPSVPEPGSFVLIAASSFGLLLRRRRC